VSEMFGETYNERSGVKLGKRLIQIFGERLDELLDESIESNIK
jgi:hypothetical protein